MSMPGTVKREKKKQKRDSKNDQQSEEVLPLAGQSESKGKGKQMTLKQINGQMKKHVTSLSYQRRTLVLGMYMVKT